MTSRPEHRHPRLAALLRGHHFAGKLLRQIDLNLIRMSRELEALLARAVDVVSAGGLKSRDQGILAELVDL